MIKRKSKALLCAIASIGFINSIEIIHANAYNNSFSDTKGHWAEAEISKFNDLGYISGYEDKTFKPNNSVTRAEFVKILNNVFGLTKSTNASIAELINSVDITSPNNIKHINHSKYDIFNNIPSAITVIQIITCINIFCSFLKA